MVVVLSNGSHLEHELIDFLASGVATRRVGSRFRIVTHVGRVLNGTIVSVSRSVTVTLTTTHERSLGKLRANSVAIPENPLTFNRKMVYFTAEPSILTTEYFYYGLNFPNRIKR